MLCKAKFQMIQCFELCCCVLLHILKHFCLFRSNTLSACLSKKGSHCNAAKTFGSITYCKKLLFSSCTILYTFLYSLHKVFVGQLSLLKPHWSMGLASPVAVDRFIFSVLGQVLVTDRSLMRNHILVFVVF